MWENSKTISPSDARFSPKKRRKRQTLDLFLWHAPSANWISIVVSVWYAKCRALAHSPALLPSKRRFIFFCYRRVPIAGLHLHAFDGSRRIHSQFKSSQRRAPREGPSLNVGTFILYITGRWDRKKSPISAPMPPTPNYKLLQPRLSTTFKAPFFSSNFTWVNNFEQVLAYHSRYNSILILKVIQNICSCVRAPNPKFNL